MRYKILLPLCLFFSLMAIAQQKPDKAFAIVGAGNNSYNWMNVLEIDLSTGEVTRNIYEKEKTSFQLFDSKTRKELNDKTKLAEHRAVAANKPTQDKNKAQGTVGAPKEVVLVNGYGSKQNAWRSATPNAAAK